MRQLIFVCAAGLAAACATSASALPTAKPGAAIPRVVQSAAGRDDEHDHDKTGSKHDQDHKKRNDEEVRYELYKDWHRHHHIPHDWRKHNCVEVGRFWFCP